MSGRETTRGIFLQAIVCLLEALQGDNDWTSLSLEPDIKSEKVDIAWYYKVAGNIKVTQVKSSQNQINVPFAKRCAEALENSVEATSYELILIGPCSYELSKGQIYGKVKVPPPNPLNIQGLIEQAAHRLADYLEFQRKPAGTATVREGVIRVLISSLQQYSSEGESIPRDEFEALLNGWVRDALDQATRSSQTRLLSLSGKIGSLLQELPQIKKLHLDHPRVRQKRGTARRYLNELDEALPGDSFVEQYDLIPWHPPDKPADDTPQQRAIYTKACNILEGLLGDAQSKIKEALI